MRSSALLLFCYLAVSTTALTITRQVRDADDDSEEYLSAKFRSSLTPDLKERNNLIEATPFASDRSPRFLILKKKAKLVKIAKVAVLMLVASGTIDIGDISSTATQLSDGVSNLVSNIENAVDGVTDVANTIGNTVGDISEFLSELPANLPFGSRRESMALEAARSLQDLNTLLDEGALTAVTTLQRGVVGELSFAQAIHPSADNDVTIISGTLHGLAPGLHKLQVTKSGVLPDDCGNAGPAYSDESDGVFVANDEGKALVVIRVGNAPLWGSDTILGRSVKITSESDTDANDSCGIIVHSK